MLAFPRRGLVLLSMPKCGSTAIEGHLARRAAVAFTGARLKHLSMADFERRVQPLLADAGYPRSGYEVACLFREPVDWLHSWWRYRSRPELAAADDDRRENFTGELSFDEFAEAYMDASQPAARVVGDRQATFVQGLDGTIGVDRIFRYERMDQFAAYVEERLGGRFSPERANVSPDRSRSLSPDVERRLVEHLAPEYAIYARTDTATLGR